jgi:hypothetical protein
MRPNGEDGFVSWILLQPPNCSWRRASRKLASGHNKL